MITIFGKKSRTGKRQARRFRNNKWTNLFVITKSWVSHTKKDFLLSTQLLRTLIACLWQKMPTLERRQAPTALCEWYWSNCHAQGVEKTLAANELHQAELILRFKKESRLSSSAPSLFASLDKIQAILRIVFPPTQSQSLNVQRVASFLRQAPQISWNSDKFEQLKCLSKLAHLCRAKNISR